MKIRLLVLYIGMVVVVGTFGFLVVSVEQSFDPEEMEEYADWSPPRLSGDPEHSVEGGEGSEPEEGAYLIAGRIVWPDGGSFENGLLSLEPPDGSGEAWQTLVNPREGHFRFRVHSPEMYLLTARFHDQCDWNSAGCVVGQWRMFAAGDEQLLQVVQPPDDPVRVIAIEGPDGRPVASAQAVVDLLGYFGGQQSRRLAVKNGVLRFSPELPARQFLLTVHQARDAERQALAATTTGPLAVDSVGLKVRLPKERVLAGRVFGEDGEPLGAVKVTASLAPPILNWHGDRRRGVVDLLAVTAPDGRFVQGGLGEGDWTVFVEPPEPWIAPDAFPFDPDAGEIRIELRRGVSPRVQVLDAQGLPVPCASVHVRGGAPALAKRQTGSDGVARIGPLDPSVAYHLVVDPPGGRVEIPPSGLSHEELLNSMPQPPTLNGASIPEWVPGNVTVRLEAREPAPGDGSAERLAGAGELRVRFVDPPSMGGIGKQWVSAELIDELGEAPDRCVQLPLDGGVITGLEENGIYTLRIVGIGSGVALEAGGLQPGPNPVELRFLRGPTIRGRIDLPPGAKHANIRATRGGLRLEGDECAVVEKDGSFVIRGLLPGRWRLEVTVEAEGGLWWAEMEAEAGARGIRLIPRLPPQ